MTHNNQKRTIQLVPKSFDVQYTFKKNNYYYKLYHHTYIIIAHYYNITNYLRYISNIPMIVFTFSVLTYIIIYSEKIVSIVIIRQ